MLDSNVKHVHAAVAVGVQGVVWPVRGESDVGGAFGPDASAPDGEAAAGRRSFGAAGLEGRRALVVLDGRDRRHALAMNDGRSEWNEQKKQKRTLPGRS